MIHFPVVDLWFLLVLFKTYSDNRDTNFNGFFCGIMPVLLISDPCYMHLDFSKDFILPRNHQTTSDGPRTMDFLLPVTIQHLDIGVFGWVSFGYYRFHLLDIQ